MSDWTFAQLGGSRKRLTLSGASAPHGRPRKKPVVSDGIEIRQSETYYPGYDEPTRHIFGSRAEAFELEGRFMDSVGGKGFAQKMTEYVKGFVDDKQRVEVRWEDTIAAVGLIDAFVPSRESKGHIAWKMRVLIDKDLLITVRKTKDQVDPKDVKDHMADIQNGLKKLLGETAFQKPITSFPPSLDFGIIDQLDLLVGAINTPFAMVSSMADQIGSLEKGAIGALRRFRAGLHQMKTATLKLRSTYENHRSDLAIQSSYADEELRFFAVQSASGPAMLGLLKSIDAADRAAARAERGKIRALYTAKTGDTWESIARITLEDASRGSDIQMANSASGLPSPGELYLIPR